jgi:SAM-dependent methyltransferase
MNAQGGHDISLPCKICSSPAAWIGRKAGTYKKGAEFDFFRCPQCRFTFVGNPWLEYQRIYNEAYYNGRGADTSVNYVFELDHPEQTVRVYEWRGIISAVQACVPVSSATRWLDFGCGNGGLVRYGAAQTGCAMFGYEDGWISDRARRVGLPVFSSDEIKQFAGSFDVVTAIEVLEHVPEPVEELRKIRSFLKPGGLFFFTTGNAAPHRSRLLKWSYALPEVHISFYEPATLDAALRKAGFRPESKGFLPGFEDIIRFKVLKMMRVRKRSRFEQMLPWRLLSRVVDLQRQASALPVGWAE